MRTHTFLPATQVGAIVAGFFLTAPLNWFSLKYGSTLRLQGTVMTVSITKRKKRKSGVEEMVGVNERRSISQAERAAVAIENAIVRGELKPGGRVQEPRLAVTSCVSTAIARAPNSDGLPQPRPNTGASSPRYASAILTKQNR